MESFQKALFLAVKDRFDRKWIRDKNSDCWIWSGAVSIYGYGLMSVNSNMGAVYAHRLSWMLKNDKIVPDGMHVCHKCDNPPCVNPDHLFLGTHQDNMDDMYKKGRARRNRGSKNHASRLTESDVIEIRDSKVSGSLMAIKFGVSRQLVSLIRQRKLWQHI